MLYLITYNNMVNSNNAPFFSAIQALGRWWHYLDNTWIVSSDLSAAQIYQQLSPYLNVSFSNLLVIKIDTDIANREGWLPREAWDWITQNG